MNIIKALLKSKNKYILEELEKQKHELKDKIKRKSLFHDFLIQETSEVSYLFGAYDLYLFKRDKFNTPKYLKVYMEDNDTCAEYFLKKSKDSKIIKILEKLQKEIKDNKSKLEEFY